MNNYNKMWNEHYEPKLSILTTMCCMEMRRDYKQKALEEAKLFLNWNEMDQTQLKLFYPTSLHLDDIEAITNIKQIIKNNSVDVMAHFEMIRYVMILGIVMMEWSVN